MRAIIQRVQKASVNVSGDRVAEIGNGLLILLGVGKNDDEQKVRLLAEKISHLRIFADDKGKMNLSILDTAGSAIVVSQFTLFADTRKGNRPSFIEAAPPDLASPLCDKFVEALRGLGIPTQNGIFGAHMQVEILNDGPVTISLDM
jgi:D-tyrosyl-tRNA(Tyr) deacylase